MQRTNSNNRTHNRDSRNSNGFSKGRNNSNRGSPGGFSKFSENRNNSGRSFSGRNNSKRATTFHDAVCDKCGQNCTLPFKPTEGKPVLCRDCFSKNKPAQGSNFKPKKSFGNRGLRNDGPKKKYPAVCDKCKKNCEVPFKPTQGKPILCSECYNKR